MLALIQALCWSYPGSVLVQSALHCPDTSAWKWLNGKTPQRTNRKGLEAPHPQCHSHHLFHCCYFSCPFDPKMVAGGVVGGELLFQTSVMFTRGENTWDLPARSSQVWRHQPNSSLWQDLRAAWHGRA